MSYYNIIKQIERCQCTIYLTCLLASYFPVYKQVNLFIYSVSFLIYNWICKKTFEYIN